MYFNVSLTLNMFASKCFCAQLNYYIFIFDFFPINLSLGAFLLLAAGLCAISSAIAIYIIQPYDAIFRWVSDELTFYCGFAC